MDKEKEIEKLSEFIFKNHSDNICDVCGSNDTCHEFDHDACGMFYFIAKDIVDKGYGNVKQAVKEFAEKVKPLISEIVELMFNDDEPQCKVNHCHKGDDIPCGSSICIEENTQVWMSKIDELLKDLYGDES